MIIVKSYRVAIMMCVVTMLCWGSWANTQKLATEEWAFQLFYWDYSIGVLLLALVLGLTMGNQGKEGRNFFHDLSQAKGRAIGFAFLGGVVFNLANILLVAAIDIAGMAVAFPIGIGIALLEGVLVNYVANRKGNPILLFLGVAAIIAAIILDAVAYSRLPSPETGSVGLGIVLSVGCGLLMGLFYYLVQAGMVADFKKPEAGKLGPYAAVLIFSVGLFLSSFIWNSIVMAQPFKGDPVAFGDYFSKGTTMLHLVGILGGVIWSIGMSLNIIASGNAGPAIAYGLGQGATMVAAFWGVFVWKEFKAAPSGTSLLLGFMFALYLVGIILIIAARSSGDEQPTSETKS